MLTFTNSEIWNFRPFYLTKSVNMGPSLSDFVQSRQSIFVSHYFIWRNLAWYIECQSGVHFFSNQDKPESESAPSQTAMTKTIKYLESTWKMTLDETGSLSFVVPSSGVNIIWKMTKLFKEKNRSFEGLPRPCLSRPYSFKFFERCLPQNLLSPILNTLSHIIYKKLMKFS